MVAIGYLEISKVSLYLKNLLKKLDINFFDLNSLTDLSSLLRKAQFEENYFEECKSIILRSCDI